MLELLDHTEHRALQLATYRGMSVDFLMELFYKIPHFTTTLHLIIQATTSQVVQMPPYHELATEVDVGEGITSILVDCMAMLVVCIIVDVILDVAVETTYIHACEKITVDFCI